MAKKLVNAFQDLTKAMEEFVMEIPANANIVGGGILQEVLEEAVEGLEQLTMNTVDSRYQSQLAAESIRHAEAANNLQEQVKHSLNKAKINLAWDIAKVKVMAPNISDFNINDLDEYTQDTMPSVQQIGDQSENNSTDFG